MEVIVGFLATWIAYALAAYGAIGVLFAVPFVLLGAARIDPNAQGATTGFRALIFPGSVALWPWLLARWTRPGRREERSPHRLAHGPIHEPMHDSLHTAHEREERS
jgi:hypothetical protein